MSIAKIEAELEAALEETRKQIAEQLSMVGESIQSVDPTLYDKERSLVIVLKGAREHWNVNKAEQEEAHDVRHAVMRLLSEEAEIEEDFELTTYFLVYRWAHNGDSLNNGCIDSSSITVPASKTLPQAVQQFLQWAANDEFDREDADGGIATYSAYVDRIVRIDGLNKVVDVSAYEINSHIEGIEFVVEQEENGTD